MIKKKIAFVVAAPGSAESFLVNHFEKFVKEYEVTLIANFSKDYDTSFFSNMGVRCVDVPIERQISIRNDFEALLALWKIFKKESFASVHSITPKAGLLTSIAAWLAGIKVRIHIYTGQVWATRKGMMRYLLKTMDKIIALFDNHILVDGESQRQFLIKEGVLKDSNSEVLAHGSICGVKLEKFFISADVRNVERKKFNFNEGDVVFIFLGRLNHDKGIDELYAAFNQLAIECPNAKLLLYGTDEEEYEKKAVAYQNLKHNENFFYPGLTRTPYDALQGGDVFVLPTWREGFGSSVIEAQALGLPVITSDAYGVCDASVPEVTGLRCKVGDAKGLYRCMKRYYEHPELRKLHGEAGRRRVFELFGCEVVSQAWLDYYKSLLQDSTCNPF